MKINYLIFPALIASGLLAGCSKDFLKTEPTEFMSQEQLAVALEEDPKLLGGTVGGLYSTMYTTGVGGTTRHDDFGQKGVDIYMDMIQSDMVLGALNYGWYSTVARYQATTNYTSNEAYIPWRYYYRIVFGANTLIGALGGDDATPETPETKAAMGQAKAMRAYAHFYVSQLYSKEYGDGSQKIIPIYNTTEQFNQPKSTAKEVFDFIVKDLRDALVLLDGFNRTAKNQVNKDVAKGLLAYVLSARGSEQDLNEVVTLTQELMDKFPVTTKDQVVYNGSNLSTSGFNSVTTPSWIWGVDLTTQSELDLVSWWGQVDYFTYSYSWAGDPKLVDKALYSSIADDDIRKEQFVSIGTSGNNLQPRNKFFDPGRTAGGQRVVTTDYIYMRSDEFYLMNAEAKARLNQNDAAKTALKDYLTKGARIADLSFIDGLTGSEVIDEIYHQSRIELWGEGKSYLIMKRLKQDVVRGSNHLFEAGKTIPWDDDKLTFLIPQAEELNNPNLNK